jgi:hypothetical protein
MRKLLVGWPIFVVLITCCLGFAQSAGLGDATSREGCKNQWLFNGVWRVKISDVQPHMNGTTQDGWQVIEVWRNGTFQELSPTNSALTGQRLELGNGYIDAGGLSLETVSTNNFAPAGEFTYKQIFVGSNFDPSNKPKGLLITFNNAQLSQQKQWPQFTTSKYNFHFNLGCVATGAAAQAEGGSTQLLAQTGCLNQWMSNGVWKMRVTSIGTFPAVLTKPSDQFGWVVTQTWVNASGRKIRSGMGQDSPTGRPGDQYIGTTVTDEYLATQGGNNASSANMTGGFQLGSTVPRDDWMPGQSATLKQAFSWGGFDPTDKPTRLLVTFNDKVQNATPGVPHYRKPADFRIDLTCTK